MTLLYLVRHGQIDRRMDATDPPLSHAGRLEAEQLAANLGIRPIARVYASPLRRARETATPLAVALGLQLQVEPLLRERANFGDLPGQSFEAFVALWERCSRERDFVPPVGDSSRVAGARLESFVAALYRQLPDGEVVAVTHGGLIADFLFNICTPVTLAQLSPAFAAQPYSGDVMRYGAVTVVEYAEAVGGVGRYEVRAIASAAHLP